MRTHGAKVHEAREGYSPDVVGVENIATIKLEELVLDTRMGERSAK